jgi:uncharacterized membrane protein YgcG
MGRSRGQYIEKRSNKTLNHSEQEEDHLPLEAVPERIRINSNPLSEVLKNIIGGSFRGQSEPFVILRPFKSLVFHADDLRQALVALEARWSVKADKLVGEAGNEVKVDVKEEESKQQAGHGGGDGGGGGGGGSSSNDATPAIHEIV